MAAAPKTERLYLEDPYKSVFRASLVDCKKRDDGRIVATLDKTYFYPESGGQIADRGEIAGVDVLDVWEEGPDHVFHAVAGEVPQGEVNCVMDWERRFDHMQQHTGQHLLSRAFIEVGGLETVSFHMGEESCTIDLEGGDVSEAAIEKAEDLSNGIIWEDRKVIVRTVSLDELKDLPLRKSLPEHVTEARLVEIEGFDVIGCCGTHVRRTGELGLVKVLKHEKAKGAWRVSFKTGRRALVDFKAKHDITKRLAQRFTTSIEGIEEKVEKLQSESQNRRKDLQKISKTLAAFEAQQLLQRARKLGDRRFVVEVVDVPNDDHFKQLASALKSQANTISLIATKKGSVICNASKDVTIDIAERVIKHATAVGGSGGGKGGFASARLPDGVAAADFLEQLFEDVKTI